MKDRIIIKPTDPVHLFPEEIMKTGSVELQTQDGTEAISDASELIEKVNDARSEIEQKIEHNMEKSLQYEERMKKIK